MNTYHIYTVCISSALNGSSALQHFKHGSAIELIRNGIMFDFYIPGTPPFVKRCRSSCSELPSQQGQGDHIKTMYLLFNFFQKDGILHDSTARRVCGREAQGDRQFVLSYRLRASQPRPRLSQCTNAIFCTASDGKLGGAWERGQMCILSSNFFVC